MSISPTRFIKRWCEFIPKEELVKIPSNTRGIYSLLKFNHRSSYEVVYIGMAHGPRAGIRGRLKIHAKNKGKLWTHFSAFEVWDNVTRAEILELEGLFRQIYRLDPRANKLNVQKNCSTLKKVRVKLDNW